MSKKDFLGLSDKKEVLSSIRISESTARQLYTFANQKFFGNVAETVRTIIDFSMDNKDLLSIYIDQKRDIEPEGLIWSAMNV